MTIKQSVPSSEFKAWFASNNFPIRFKRQFWDTWCEAWGQAHKDAPIPSDCVVVKREKWEYVTQTLQSLMTTFQAIPQAVFNSAFLRMMEKE